MRQAGLLAACGMVSLTQMVDRLADDHSRAKAFGKRIQNVPGVTCELNRIETNMVMVDTVSPALKVMQKLSEAEILCLPTGPNRLRFVFHADIDDAKTERAIDAISDLKL
jgi:threonine aldolase